jgi:PBP1b-binding outer membrane lipoprotein LpoB
MKKNYMIITLTIALILCSCSSQSQPPTTSQKNQQPISTQPQKSVELPEKAEKVCGDRPPTDPKAYPVSFYPISVEYTDRNLELVKKHFCEDAIKIQSKSLGKEVVQVASFTSQEKANSFKDKLSQHFSQATIGQPTIVEKLASDVGDRKSSDESFDTVESIAKAALLNSEQVQQLLDLEKSTMFYSKGRNKEIEVGKVKALVPTYIPSGFKLTEFSRISSTPKSEYEQRYKLGYKSSTGEAFDVANSEMLGDGPAFFCDVGRLEHPLLGQIRLWGSGVDKIEKGGELSFQVPYTLFYQSKPTGYYFYSGGTVGKAISREEAVKVVNSLKSLNPRTEFDSLPGKAKWGTLSESIKAACSSQSLK